MLGQHPIKIWASIALLLSVVLHVVWAADPPKLGITRDLSADKKKLHLWSSIVTYEKPTAELFSDAELNGLARQAYREMIADFKNVNLPVPRHEKDRTKEWRPATMAALAVGNKVYFSSSLKGQHAFLYQWKKRGEKSPPEVVDALNRCQMALQEKAPEDATVDGQHRVGAACGEVLANHLYYLDPKQPKDDGNAKVTAWGLAEPRNFEYRENHPDGEFMKPCGGGGKPNSDGHISWGCRQFMKNEGVRPIEKADVKDKTPPVEPKSKGHLGACDAS